MNDPADAAPLPNMRTGPHDHQRQSMLQLAVGAIGVVFGDIGTSPIYAFRETFAGAPSDLRPDPLHIHGVLSLVFWSMMIVVTFKYVLIIMRADNKGEGGSLALLALINRKIRRAQVDRAGSCCSACSPRALFYGDSHDHAGDVGAVGDRGAAIPSSPASGPWIVPIAIAILVGLFAIQARGTEPGRRLFGPIMLVYFATLAVLGHHAHRRRSRRSCLHTSIRSMRSTSSLTDGLRAFLAMGSVVLAVTGAEALYADMGHFGRKPIGCRWLVFVLPALMLNYMGQGAMVLSLDADRCAASDQEPVLPDGPRDGRALPLVILATLATIIASQAVISGAFSRHPAGDPARLHAAHCGSSTPARQPRGRSISR